MATRQASAEVLQTVAGASPGSGWGRAADLAGSNKTFWTAVAPLVRTLRPARTSSLASARLDGRGRQRINLHGDPGLWEHLLVFTTDYLRAAIAIQAALMHLPSIFIGTHDSTVGTGDGRPPAGRAAGQLPGDAEPRHSPHQRYLPR